MPCTYGDRLTAASTSTCTRIRVSEALGIENLHTHESSRRTYVSGLVALCYQPGASAGVANSKRDASAGNDHTTNWLALCLVIVEPHGMKRT